MFLVGNSCRPCGHGVENPHLLGGVVVGFSIKVAVCVSFLPKNLVPKCAILFSSYEHIKEGYAIVIF